MTIYLFSFKKSMLGLASRKGIAITAAILAGMAGGSFLVWYVPQSNPSILDIPHTDAEIVSDIYSRHLDLASTVESDFSNWKNGTKSAGEMLSSVDSAIAQTQQMKREIERQPAAEWRKSYDLYGQALNVFEEYLGKIKSAVESGNTSAQQEIDDLKSKWQDYVEQSVQAMPIAR